MEHVKRASARLNERVHVTDELGGQQTKDVTYPRPKAAGRSRERVAITARRRHKGRRLQRPERSASLMLFGRPTTASMQARTRYRPGSNCPAVGIAALLVEHLGVAHVQNF